MRRSFFLQLFLSTASLLGLEASRVARFLQSDNEDILIEDFSPSRLSWRNVNDPVMGGQSWSEMHFGDVDSNTNFQYIGEVKLVPSLHAPGFIKLEGSGNIPDVSACQAIEMVVRSTKTNYKGYRFEFGTRHDPAATLEFIGGYKAHFYLENTEDFQMVVIPFHDFSVDWDPYTGDAIITCEQNPDYCPDFQTLTDMRKIAIMGEGVEGDVDLEIKSISATMCGKDTALLPTSVIDTPSSQASEGRTSSLGVYTMYGCMLSLLVGALYYAKRRQQNKALDLTYQAVGISESNSEEGNQYHELEMS